MSNRFKGIIFVAVGASSYGIVATFIKKGLGGGYTIAELTFSQAFVGVIGMLLINIVVSIAYPAVRANRPDKKDVIKLLLGGIPMGLTSTFYYLSLRYVSVSICIVMLMQSVWMGTVIDYFVNKVKPSKTKVLSIVVILIGTVFATDILQEGAHLDWRGIASGMLAALAYSFTFLATNNIATKYRPVVRSLYLLIGSLIIVSVVWSPSLVQKFDPNVLWTWGIPLAFFGTILPPLLFTKGMPLIGVSLGAIMASAELPVSVTMAYVFIHEDVHPLQWFGIILILLAIIKMNMAPKDKLKSN